ncbi:MAG: peptidylprolyl isomerase [Steroidobacter sp.]
MFFRTPFSKLTMKQLIVTALLTFFSLLPAVSGADQHELSTRGVLLDRIVAIVNDGVVLSSDLDTETGRIVARLKQQKTDIPDMDVLRKQVLERLVNEELEMQRADKAGLKVSDEMLNAQLNEVAKQNGVKFSDLPALLEAQGENYAEYREFMRKQITLDILQQRAVIANIEVTPRELDQFLAKQKRMPDANAQYNLSHILIAVSSSATPEEQAKREARAQEVYNKAKAGQSFAELAVSYSDSSTNVDGGSLGWRNGGQLPSIIADRIPAMKAGDVTEPIRTPSGFNIFKLNEVRGGVEQQMQQQVHVRHILLKTNEIEDDSTVKLRLEKIRERILAGEDFAAIASVTSQDTGSAVQGGDLGWAGPGTFVPEFEKAIEGLKVNEISEPFKTQYGWHIVQLLGRRTEDISDEVLRNRAYQAIQESKAEEAINLWIRELRDNAYIEYLM